MPFSVGLDPGGAESYGEVGDLAAGDRVRFLAGDIVAVDGTLVEGEVLVSEAVLTGEPTAIKKVAGDPLVAGSEVVDGELLVEVRRPFRETMLFHIIESISGSLSKSELHIRSADRIAQWFSPAVLAIALGTWIDLAATEGSKAAFTSIEAVAGPWPRLRSVRSRLAANDRPYTPATLPNWRTTKRVCGQCPRDILPLRSRLLRATS